MYCGCRKQLRRRGGGVNLRMKKALIIFVRNAERGKVKTRLAASIGEDNALKVYNLLLAHTREIAGSVNCDRFVFYAESIAAEDQWDNAQFFKRLQHGEDLGKRMSNACKELFDQGFHKVCIIGSDCYELTSTIITDAFSELSYKDVVIGRARDGGYYLIGMQKHQERLFINKSWSSDTVFRDTMHDINMARLSFATLPLLSDVDEVKDITFDY